MCSSAAAAQANGLDGHKTNGQAAGAMSSVQAQALLQQVREAQWDHEAAERGGGGSFPWQRCLLSLAALERSVRRVN